LTERPLKRDGYDAGNMGVVKVRQATQKDAAAIARVMEAVASERVHTAIDRAWTVEQEARYLESLSAREAFHLAEDEEAGVVGCQSLDLWSPTLSSIEGLKHRRAGVLQGAGLLRVRPDAPPGGHRWCRGR
jgi:hypothetical protein